jgi:transcriptional regulator with XRE-family HTH domain
MRRTMNIGERLRELRQAKELSQGNVEKRTGLMRCYISRVEHGYTVLAVSTLEKFARAFEVPIYLMLYQGTETLPPPNPKKGVDVKGKRLLSQFEPYLAKLSERDRDVLLATAKKMAVKAKNTS